MSEPHCFARLTPGEYLVAVEPAPGAQSTSDQRWSVVLGQGTTATVDFGSRAVEKKAGTSSGGEGALGLALAAAVLGGIGVLIYRQRKASAGIS
jgi:MYXO-CTERM domain-containing protein